MSAEFRKWPKIPRVGNETFTITEKLDGTNGQILMTQDEQFFVGSRSQWITTDKDNHGFAHWAIDRKIVFQEIIYPHRQRVYGEFIGLGINRNYGLDQKYFMIFDQGLRQELLDTESTEILSYLACHNIGFVPLLAEGILLSGLYGAILKARRELFICGSLVNEFKRPEGLVIKGSVSGVIWKDLINT